MKRMIRANDPQLTSWISVPSGSDFPIQNLPFGIFKTDSLSPRVGSRIGNQVIDLKSLFVLGYLENLPFSQEDFDTHSLNNLMRRGKKGTRVICAIVYPNYSMRLTLICATTATMYLKC
jgi:fumarylacetoacetase